MGQLRVQTQTIDETAPAEAFVARVVLAKEAPPF
jgi:hypothetical protein